MTDVVIEFTPGVRESFVTQAFYEPFKAWLTITMPMTDLGVAQNVGMSFANSIGVNTRIKKLNTLPDTEKLSTQVKSNRGLFTDAYRK